MPDYPKYDIVIDGVGAVPFRINNILVMDSEQARQIIIKSGYTLPILFSKKWEAKFGCGDKNKNGQTWLEFKYEKSFTIIIMR